MAGYFIAHRDGNYVALNASPQGNPFEAIYHEYVPHFMTNNFTRLPLWLNEGLAECYRTIRIEGSEVAIGLPLDDDVGMLRRGKLPPSPAHPAIDGDNAPYHENETCRRFYSQSLVPGHYP